MFGELTIAYLFCGGAGSGALLVAALFSFCVRRGRLLTKDQVLGDCPEDATQALTWTFLMGLALLLFGALCLLFDMGRVDRVALLLLSFRPTWVNIGAVLLTIELALGVCIVASRFLQVPKLVARIQLGCYVLCIAFGAAVMAYTGLLLGNASSVDLWSNVLLSPFFFLSSLSCGYAIYLLSACTIRFNYGSCEEVLMKVALRHDLAVVVLETVAFVLFVATSLHDGRSTATDSVEHLFFDDGVVSLIWSIGYIMLGLVVPLLAEIGFGIISKRRSAYAVAGFADVTHVCLALCILIGSLSLRFGIVVCGQHADMGLASPVPVASSLSPDSLLRFDV